MDAVHWPSALFLLLGSVACLFAVAVVVAQNVVHMAFYLIVSLSAVAGLFFLAGADFVGAMQIMIYVGGTLVLLVFGVMLTAQGPFIQMRTPSGEVVLSLLVGFLLLAFLTASIQRVSEWQSDASAVTVQNSPPQTSTPLGMGLLGARVDRPHEKDAAGYLLVFEIISVHLLVVLVGAAYLARAKRRSSAPPAG